MLPSPSNPGRLLLVPFLLLIMVLGVAASAAPGGVPTAPLSDLRPGMRGYGLSVFQGTKITRFPVTVLGVSRGFLAGSDMILIRVDGGYVREHGTGIIAGMSGSPVYVEGRLIGAISYGWPFQKEPIGGVTPIDSMLAELPDAARPVPVRPPWGAVGRLERPVQVGGRTYDEIRLTREPSKTTGKALELAPITTLLQTSGLDSKALERLNKGLQPLPMRAVQGFQGPRLQRGIPPMVPGAAVGVSLLTGDLEIAGTGTLTWRQGNTILAFGHPMADLGEVSLPLSAAWVHTVLPSYQFSVKMSSQLGVVGEMTRDRLWAIGGSLHAPAPMIPLRLEVSDPVRGRRKVWNLKAAQQRYLTPVLLGTATSYALGSMVPSMHQATAKVRYRIQAAGQPPLDMSDMVVGPNLDAWTSNRFQGLVGRLVDNPFEPLRIQSARVEVEILPGRRLATVERLYTDRTRYHPGETVRLGVVLRPYGEEPQVREIALPLPSDARKGTIKIGVAGGDEWDALRKALVLEETEPATLGQLMADLQSDERGADLAIRMVMPEEGVAVSQRPLPLLPNALRTALSSSSHSEVGKAKEVLRRSVDTPWVLRGKAVVEIQVAPSDTAPTTSDKKSDKPPAMVSDLAGGGRTWSLQGPERLAAGAFQGVALDASGSLTRGPALTPVYRSSDALAWSLARGPRGELLLGLGGTGEVLRAEGGGVFGRTGQAAVTALAADTDGVWAGTAPDGVLVRWDTQGKESLRVRLPASYVWALQAAPHGGVYVGAGAPGSVQHVDLRGRVREVWTGGAQHVRALAPLPDGRLLLATAGDGLLLRLDPTTGRADTLFESPGGDLEALAVSGGSAWTASGSAVYALPLEGGEARRVYAAPSDALTLAPDGAGGVWAGLADGSLVRVRVDGSSLRVPATTPRPVLALLSDSGGVLAARSFSAEVFRLDAEPATGEYTSDILDAGRPSRWGGVRWLAIPGGTVEVQTRSGATPLPDDTWSPWSLALSRAGGDPVLSPPARYLQLRVRLAGPAPRVQGLTIGFAPQGTKPAVAWIEPRGGERWNGTRTLKWRLEGGEPAQVSYDVELSGDGGATWKPLSQGFPATGPEGSLVFGTGRYPDGVYQIRLAAYDRSDPNGTRTDVLSGPVLLANSKAELAWLGKGRGLARSPVAAITEVQYRAGNGPWRPAQAVDGLFDSTREEFTLDAGEGAVEVRIRDEAGNETLESKDQ